MSFKNVIRIENKKRVAGITKPVNYSTDEHIIGTWVDGSTLYEKTVNFGTLPNNAGKYTAHGILNLSEIVGIEAVGIRSDRTFPLPNSGANSSEAAYGMRMFVDKTSGIYIATGQDMTDTIGYVTLRYTKTS